MKKIITTVMLAVAAICSTAQAGDFYLGGAVGFMHRSDRDATTNEFTIKPSSDTASTTSGASAEQ